MTTTQIRLGDAIDLFGVEVLDYLDRDMLVPVLDRLMFQGDVAAIPRRPGKTAHQTIPVPATGVVVVRGESGGNTHLLLADGPCLWTALTGDNLAVGLVTIPDGSIGYLAHPEHGYLGLAPGVWELRRQREQTEEIRTVAD